MEGKGITMKKIVSLLVCACMAGTLLAGCGSSKSSETKAEEGKTVLKMWSQATKSNSLHDAYLVSIEEFEKENPGVEIKLETYEGESYKTKLKSSVAANELPDIFMTWGAGWSQSFVDSGKLLDLTKYYEDYKTELPEKFMNYATYNNKVYGTPFMAATSLMFYNKDMFEKQGVEVPTTYEELISVCQKFIDSGITPMAVSAKEAWVIAMVQDALALKTAGPDKVQNALTKNGQSYDDEDFLLAAERFRELIDMGVFSEGATGLSMDEAQAGFTSEQIPILINGSWVAGNLEKTDNPEHFDIAPFPKCSDNAEITDYMGGAVDMFMVSNSTENADLAAKAAFEIAKKISKYAYLDGAVVPIWKKDYDDSKVARLIKKTADLTEQATSLTIWFNTLLEADDAGEYEALLQELYSGNITPKEFVKSMDEKL